MLKKNCPSASYSFFVSFRFGHCDKLCLIPEAAWGLTIPVVWWQVPPIWQESLKVNLTSADNKVFCAQLGIDSYFMFGAHILLTWLLVYHCCDYQDKVDAASMTSTRSKCPGRSVSACHQWYSPLLIALDCKPGRCPVNILLQYAYNMAILVIS